MPNDFNPKSINVFDEIDKTSMVLINIGKECRVNVGRSLHGGALNTFDWGKECLKYNNVGNLPWVARAPAYYNNFMVDQISTVTRPMVDMGGTCVGVVLDKVAGATYQLLTPANINEIISNPILANLYLRQAGSRVCDYWGVIDTNSVYNTLTNYNSLYVQRMSEMASRGSVIWNQDLKSDKAWHNISGRVQDKTRHLAQGVAEVVTDEIADTVGKLLVGGFIFGTGQRKRNTVKGVQQWERNMIYRNLFSGPFVYFGRFFILKPIMKITRNPRTFFALTGYYALSNMGQNIKAHKTLKERFPHQLAVLKGQNIDVCHASRTANLMEGLNN